MPQLLRVCSGARSHSGWAHTAWRPCCTAVRQALTPRGGRAEPPLATAGESHTATETAHPRIKEWKKFFKRIILSYKLSKLLAVIFLWPFVILWHCLPSQKQDRTLWEKARVGWSERTASKHVYYQVWNRSPAQVWCMRQVLGAGALGRPRGMGWGGRG